MVTEESFRPLNSKPQVFWKFCNVRFFFATKSHFCSFSAILFSNVERQVETTVDSKKVASKTYTNSQGKKMPRNNPKATQKKTGIQCFWREPKQEVEDGFFQPYRDMFSKQQSPPTKAPEVFGVFFVSRFRFRLSTILKSRIPGTPNDLYSRFFSLPSQSEKPMTRSCTYLAKKLQISNIPRFLHFEKVSLFPSTVTFQDFFPF